jgi:hypothetical protein
MDSQKILESLKKVSADCDKSIEKGFGPDLNILTIKKQIDDIAAMVGEEESRMVKPEPSPSVEMKGESKQQEKTEGETPEKGEEKIKVEGSTDNLSGRIDELSKEVTEKKKTVSDEGKAEGTPEVKKEEQKKDEPSGKLPSSVQEPAKILKQSSSVTEKPAGSDKT